MRGSAVDDDREDVEGTEAEIHGVVFQASTEHRADEVRAECGGKLTWRSISVEKIRPEKNRGSVMMAVARMRVSNSPCIEPPKVENQQAQYSEAGEQKRSRNGAAGFLKA